MTLPPANWYPDPTAPGTERYWDGTAWGTATRAVVVPQALAAQGSSPQAVGAPTFPPPAPDTMVSAPKRSRTGLWITLGAAGLVVIGLGVAGAIAIAGKVTPLSNDYTGVPVTASDVASDGRTLATSSSETVAVEIPDGWVDAATYVDLSAMDDGLPAGMEWLGVWFTGALDGVEAPQLVIVAEANSTAAGIGSLDDFQRQAVGGASKTGGVSGVGDTTDVTSANGLEGKRTTTTLDLGDGMSATMVIATFGHNRRLAMVMWTSYSGPVDETALQALIESLRIDA